MALGDGITWDETEPTDATVAVQIDDYDRDLRKGVRGRMAREHEWPDSQSATSEAGAHKFITMQTQGAAPTLAGTQNASIYVDTDNVMRIETSLISAAPVPRIVQVVNTQTGAVATGSTVIIYDDTIPQITEGDQYMSLAITPTSATNKLKIEVTVVISNSGNGANLTTALFQDTTANAIAAVAHHKVNATAPVATSFTHYMTTGTTSETTFKVRIGGDGGTITLNGAGAARKLGGSMASSITITEIGV